MQEYLVDEELQALREEEPTPDSDDDDEEPPSKKPPVNRDVVVHYLQQALDYCVYHNLEKSINLLTKTMSIFKTENNNVTATAKKQLTLHDSFLKPKIK